MLKMIAQLTPDLMIDMLEVFLHLPQLLPQLLDIGAKRRIWHADIFDERHHLAVVERVIGNGNSQLAGHQIAYVACVQFRVLLFLLVRMVHGQKFDLAVRVELR